MNKTTCPATALATITCPLPPQNKRMAIININGQHVNFWVENNDNPQVKEGEQVRVSFHPDDQYAKIIC